MRHEGVASLIESLRQRGETLSVAESLTGGGLGAAITEVAGASDVFLGGTIVYSNHMKAKLLNVSESTLSQFGAVSEEVANEMARGSLALFGSTWSISTTGVAGPGPSEGVSQGTVWIAIDGPARQATLLSLEGTREEVRNATVSSAITAFSRILTL